MLKEISNTQIVAVTLDSWAILAWLQGEKAGKIVKNLIGWCDGKGEILKEIQLLLGDTSEPPRLYLNLINLGEIFYILGRRQGEKAAQEVVNYLYLSPLEIVPVTEELVIRAAKLKIKYPLAYADAFAVATAQLTNSALLTGDPELKDIKEVRILWLQ